MQGAEEYTTRAVNVLRQLVAFDSVSRHSNLPLIRFVEDYLARLSIPYDLIPSPDGAKSNLLARIGPETAGGIVLSGHTDVVPVDGQAWDSEPFTLTEKNGRLYGRGTADMKSFLAVCLALAPELAKQQRSKPIYLAFSYDEEVGCLGVPHMLDHIDRHAPKPEFAVIGEPTNMQVITSHKGMLSFETVVRGVEWHSSQPQYGVNAVQVACDLVSFLAGMADELAKDGRQDARFDPPCSTVHVGVIEGGTARNIIPRECRFLWEIRPLPGEDHKALIARFDKHCREREKEIKKINPAACIETRSFTAVGAVTLPATAESACQRVMHAARTNAQQAVAFFTEGGAFQAHGIPAIVCGPGDIRQAHQPNEFIEISQIKSCAEFLLRLTAAT